MKYKQLPQGFQDYLPKECFYKDYIEARLASLYYGSGLDRVEPSSIEYLDTYAPADTAKLFKFSDSDGSMLALRSDPTVQLARIAATRTEGRLRAYYLLNSYEFLPSLTSARTREFAQGGVELIGEDGICADTEAVVLAIKSLLAIGLKDFVVELGDAGFLRGLLPNNLSSQDISTLYSLIDNKKLAEIEGFCLKCGISKELSGRINRAVQLFGGAEVLDEGREIASGESLKAIENLSKIVSTLRELDYLQYVSIDLGCVSLGYYTGLLIRGYVGGFGQIVLEGGRYNNLTARFGCTSPAVGFGVWIKRLLAALTAQGRLPKSDSRLVGYVVDEDSYADAEKYLSKLKGQSRFFRLCGSEDEIMAQAREREIDSVLFFSKGSVAKRRVEPC